MIVDHNGHPVPDGTVVKFILNQQGENVTIQQIEATTLDGIARTSIKLQSEGVHEIRVTSEPALNSQILVLNITPEQGTVISAITPTPIPTVEEANGMEVMESPQVNVPAEETEKETSPFLEWLLSSIFAWGSGLLFFFNSETYARIKDRAYVSISITIGGLLTALWLILGLPGTTERAGAGGYASLLIITLIGAAAFGFGMHLVVKHIIGFEKDR